MKFSSSLLILFFVFVQDVYSQSESISGIVSGADGVPAPNVLVTISSADFQIPVVTDSSGSYKVSDLPTGRYLVEFRQGEFNSSFTTVIYLVNSRLKLDWQLPAKRYNLNTVIVQPEADVDGFSAEEGLRLAASFNDPGRLVTSLPGVIATDDQANNVSVRGAYPFQNKWFIEGVEVLNPNHLENAGTFSDRPASSGGGVNLFSAQILGGSSFQKGVLSSNINNVSAGAFNIRLRPGDQEHWKQTAVFSLLGTELAIEGPVAKRTGILVNARYSTVGLLSALGVNFGNEKIDYYDLSFIADHRVGNHGFRFWSIAGKSSNVHHEVDSSEAEYFKDLHDISYHSTSVLAGLSHKAPLGNSFLVSTSAAWSFKQADRSESSVMFGKEYKQEDTEQELLGFNTRILKALNDHFTVSAGISGSSLYNRKPVRSSLFIPAPFVELNGKLKENTGFNLGLSTYMLDGKASFDPRAAVDLGLGKFGTIRISAGRRHQAGTGQLTAFTLMPETFQISTLSKEITHVIRLNKVLFRNTYFIERSSFISGEFDALSGRSFRPFDELHSQGWEFSADRKLIRGYYFIFSGSVFSAEESVEGSKRNALYNVDHVFNLNLGKEFIREKRVYNIDYHFFYHGSPQQFAPDVATSHFSSTPYFNEQLMEIGNYMRHDLRLAMTRIRNSYNYTVFLDIQNLTSRKNAAVYYYDPFKRSVILRYQLGIIPVLGARFYF